MADVVKILLNPGENQISIRQSKDGWIIGKEQTPVAFDTPIVFTGEGSATVNILASSAQPKLRNDSTHPIAVASGSFTAVNSLAADAQPFVVQTNLPALGKVTGLNGYADKKTPFLLEATAKIEEKDGLQSLTFNQPAPRKAEPVNQKIKSRPVAEPPIGGGQSRTVAVEEGATVVFSYHEVTGKEATYSFDGKLLLAENQKKFDADIKPQAKQYAEAWLRRKRPDAKITGEKPDAPKIELVAEEDLPAPEPAKAMKPEMPAKGTAEAVKKAGAEAAAVIDKLVNVDPAQGGRSKFFENETKRGRLPVEVKESLTAAMGAASRLIGADGNIDAEQQRRFHDNLTSALGALTEYKKLPVATKQDMTGQDAATEIMNKVQAIDSQVEQAIGKPQAKPAPGKGAGEMNLEAKPPAPGAAAPEAGIISVNPKPFKDLAAKMLDQIEKARIDPKVSKSADALKAPQELQEPVEKMKEAGVPHRVKDIRVKLNDVARALEKIDAPGTIINGLGTTTSAMMKELDKVEKKAKPAPDKEGALEKPDMKTLLAREGAILNKMGMRDPSLASHDNITPQTKRDPSHLGTGGRKI